MFSLSINPHANQAEAATAVSFLCARRSSNAERSAGQPVSPAARCVR